MIRERNGFRGLPPGADCAVHFLRAPELLEAIRERLPPAPKTNDVCFDCAKRAHDYLLRGIG